MKTAPSSTHHPQNALLACQVVAASLVSFSLAASSGCETAIAPPDITCIAGDFVVNRIDEVQSLRTARCVTGDLVIAVAGVDSIEAPYLESVEGDLVVVNTTAPSLILPALQSVGGALLVQANASLLVASFDALTDVGSHVVINGNPLLGAASLPVLAQTGGDFTVGGNERLANIDLASLAETGGSYSLVDNPLLTAVLANGLARVGGSFVIRSPALSRFAFEPLREVGRSFVVEDTPIRTIDLSQLEDLNGPFRIVNANVSTVRLGEAAEVTTLELRNLLELESLDFLDGRLANEMDTVSLTQLPLVEDADVLDQIGDVLTLTIRDLDQASRVDLSGLVRAGVIEVFRAGPHVDLGSLTTVDTNVFVSAQTCALNRLETVGANLSVEMRDNGGNPVTGCEFERLAVVGGQLAVYPFPAFGFPALTSVGNLTLRGEGFPTQQRTLASLETVSGQLVLQDMRAAEFPRLTSVGGIFIRNLETTLLPLLEEAAQFSIDSLPVNGTVVAPNLLEVDDFFASNSRVPEGIDIETAATINLYSVSTAGLGFVREMTTWGTVQFNDLQGSDVEFPNVTTATGTVDIRWSRELRTLSLPALQQVGGNGFYIQGLEALETLDLSALNQAPAFTFSYGGTFDVCSLAPLVERLETSGTAPNAIYIEGFDEICQAP